MSSRPRQSESDTPPGAAPDPAGPEETLVVDARAGLSPAVLVEHKLLSLLGGGAAAGSHVRMGPPRARGVEGRATGAGDPPAAGGGIREGRALRVVRVGDTVGVHYTKHFEGGAVVHSHGQVPTDLTVGVDHPRLPGLGLALVGLAVGESGTVLVPARRAYGPYDPDRLHRLARTRFAGDEGLRVGGWLRLWDGRRRRLVRVAELGEHLVVIDANHRWAGQSVELVVEVMTIRGWDEDSANLGGSHVAEL